MQAIVPGNNFPALGKTILEALVVAIAISPSWANTLPAGINSKFCQSLVKAKSWPVAAMAW